MAEVTSEGGMKRTCLAPGVGRVGPRDDPGADAEDARADDPRSAIGPITTAFRGGRRIALRPEAALFTEGDASDRVILLLEGRVKISMFSDTGQETILGYRGPGQVLGDLSALDGGPHSATVTVVEPGEGLAIPAARFIDSLEREPGVALALLRMLAQRQRDADQVRADYVALDVLGRVAHRLAELAAQFGRPCRDGIRIELSLSQRELAGWVGASREAVNKALAQLERAGLIGTEGRRIVILDLEALRARAT